MTSDDNKPGFSPEYSLEDVKVRIRDTSGNPNIGKTHAVDLKSGPKTYRIATIFEILDPKSKKLHHLSLRLESFDKTKAGWRLKPNTRISLESKDPNEIEALSRFLSAALSEHYPESSGEFHVVTQDQFNLIAELSKALPNLPDSKKIELAKEVFNSLDNSNIDPNEFVSTFQQITPETVNNIGIAARFVEYQAAFTMLENLIDTSGTTEKQLQDHLQSHPWIFGSEYSELLDRRTWTRDDNLDFMLRRTVDGYLEIIEIKTPFPDPLLRYDSSHDSYYQSSKLSQAIGQVLRYIDEVERQRDSIIAKDNLDPFKIRARIIIGRNQNDEHQAALRNLNAHLHRVEILTFDQLHSIGKQTLSIFESRLSTVTNIEIKSQGFDDDIPF